MVVYRGGDGGKSGNGGKGGDGGWDKITYKYWSKQKLKRCYIYIAKLINEF